MTVKETLQQLREVDQEISILENARAAAWDQATRATITPGQSGIKSRPDPHRFDNLAVLEDELSRKINALAAAKAAAVRMIYSLDNPRHREILSAYFIDHRMKDGKRKTWEAVADELHFSWSSLMQSYRDSLDALAALYPEGVPCPAVHSGPDYL